MKFNFLWYFVFFLHLDLKVPVGIGLDSHLSCVFWLMHCKCHLRHNLWKILFQVRICFSAFYGIVHLIMHALCFIVNNASFGLLFNIFPSSGL